MNTETSTKQTSKFLSLVLRHEPGKIGLNLDGQGWANVDELLQKLHAHGQVLDRGGLQDIVATCSKQRFALSDDGQRIRANQGHSITVDLGLVPVEPPPWLYHGTVSRFVGAIREQGLRPGERQHVHLSLDHETAHQVGARRGAPVILSVHAGRMHADGHVFHRSANGVWLTDHVPPQYIAD
ncbi:RNA 2'-phosphotransferase [Stenotrophomonas indicatrix]|uniref:RNA 2'-phosphotransferase n=1 Tax=Stenotrophomonas indicatrix TaxID=2045451 RepID=UPI00289F5AEF|nr:RNA 2'-phosphotransferase [Stenotrophomonas indicatrix]